MTKKYTNGEVTIVWKPEICIHSEKCFKGLSSVFDPKAKPWIDASGAPTDTIIAQVKECPSGALSTYMNDEGPMKEETNETTRIELVPNGPAIVKGRCEIAMNDGSTKTADGNTALCRCGASSNKPFCDGSHTKISFEAE